MTQERPQVSVGDVVTLKKPHPCGSYEWEVLRVGADFRLRCLGCARMILVPRSKIERRIRQVRPKASSDGEGE